MQRFQDCIYKDICEIEQCKEACMRYVEMSYMLKNSNIPKSKQKINSIIPEPCDDLAFEKLADIRENIVNFINNGKSLYIYSSNCGNGKTTWSIKLMLQYFHEMWAGNGFTERGIFIHVPTYLYDCKQNITHGNDKFEHSRLMLPKVDLVIWDEIASTKLSEYDYTQLLVLINQRDLYEKANIFTGNIKPNQLEQFVGSKLASRILGECIQIELKGGDRRGSITTA